MYDVLSVCFLFFLLFFFFQAEDGIRDAQESRGLGDVYKRQILTNMLPDNLTFIHIFHRCNKEIASILQFINRISLSLIHI